MENLENQRNNLKYLRIMLKLSGEALAEDNSKLADCEFLEKLYADIISSEYKNITEMNRLIQIIYNYRKMSGFGINFDYILEICRSIKQVHDEGVAVGITVGGGNYWRGRSNPEMDREEADHIGMLGTIMNALTLKEAFNQVGSEVRVQSAIEIPAVAETFITGRAKKHLEKDRIIVFGGGTGNPFCSTDSGASLRAAQIHADLLVKLTAGTDGIYDDDPNKNPDAKKFEKISYIDALTNPKINVMDTASLEGCQLAGIPVVVANLEPLTNLMKIVYGEQIGTYVGNVETTYAPTLNLHR